MIDPTFRNINRLFVLSFNVNTNDNDDFPEENSFDKYSIFFIEVKDFNALINKKSFFDQSIKRARSI